MPGQAVQSCTRVVSSKAVWCFFLPVLLIVYLHADDDAVFSANVRMFGCYDLSNTAIATIDPVCVQPYCSMFWARPPGSCADRYVPRFAILSVGHLRVHEELHDLQQDQFRLVDIPDGIIVPVAWARLNFDNKWSLDGPAGGDSVEAWPAMQVFARLRARGAAANSSTWAYPTLARVADQHAAVQVQKYFATLTHEEIHQRADTGCLVTLNTWQNLCLGWRAVTRLVELNARGAQLPDTFPVVRFRLDVLLHNPNTFRPSASRLAYWIGRIVNGSEGSNVVVGTRSGFGTYPPFDDLMSDNFFITTHAVMKRVCALDLRAWILENYLTREQYGAQYHFKHTGIGAPPEFIMKRFFLLNNVTFIEDQQIKVAKYASNGRNRMAFGYT